MGQVPEINDSAQLYEKVDMRRIVGDPYMLEIRPSHVRHFMLCLTALVQQWLITTSIFKGAI